MEIDTGATKSIISKETFDQLWVSDAPTIQSTNTKLRTYTGEIIKVIGEIKVGVTVEGKSDRLGLLIVEGLGPSLGRDWLAGLNINFCRQNKVCSSDGLDIILTNHASVFKDEKGHVTGVRQRYTSNQEPLQSFAELGQCPLHVTRRWNKNFLDCKSME